MRTESKKDKNIEETVSYLSINGLRGRQSVRTTFKLPEQTIQLLGIVANQLGIKQKSLFDQLVENKEVLARLMEKSREHSLPARKRRTKTFVLSRRSLEKIDSAARKSEVPRDLLVDLIIQRLGPVMEVEKEKHFQRAQFLRELRLFVIQADKMRKSAQEELGETDQATELLEKLYENCDRVLKDFEQIVERGRDLENVEI